MENKNYEITKIVEAEPMTRGEYNKLRGWITPPNENSNDTGYLVTEVDSSYITWTPKKVFESSTSLVGPYAIAQGAKPTELDDDTTQELSEANAFSRLSFSVALDAALNGKRISRDAWNGTGVFLYYVPHGVYPASSDAIKGHFINDMVPYDAYIAMKTKQGDVICWTIIQTDIFANDWYILN
jgi:hypothetical protein